MTQRRDQLVALKTTELTSAVTHAANHFPVMQLHRPWSPPLLMQSETPKQQGR